MGPKATTDVARRPPPPRSAGVAVRCGAELVELSEQLYERLFTYGLFAALAVTIYSLALVPLRGVSHNLWAVVALAGLGLGLLLALRDERAVYWLLRRRPWRFAVPIAMLIAPFFAGDPFNNPVWFAGIVLIGVGAIVVPASVALACAAVLSAGELLAYLAVGEQNLLTHDSAILAAAVGNLLVALLMATVVDRLAGFLLRLNSVATPTSDRPPKPVSATVDAAPSAVKPPPAPSLPLTARQLQVVALLRDGLRYAEIAACLGISIRQVARLVAAAKARTGAQTSSELVALAVATGVVPPR